MKNFLTTSLIGVFLIAVGSTPWLMLAFGPANPWLARFLIGIEVLALLVLVLDLAIFGAISRLVGARVNQRTEHESFSMRRIAYLLFVYLTPVSAILGLLAWAG